LNRIVPEGVELILVDDGSKPPIEIECEFPYTLHRTNNFKPWTERYARLEGVQLANSNRLICVDIDHIITEKLIRFVANTNYDFIKFRRAFAILDENGLLKTALEDLAPYGLQRRTVGTPGNCYAMSKELYLRLKARNKEKRRAHLKDQVSHLVKKGEATMCRANKRPLVYAFPNGKHCGSVDANPFGLFHNLSREMEEYNTSEKIRI
jgi:hypothetical protein